MGNACGLDMEGRRVPLTDGEAVAYNRMCVATGAWLRMVMEREAVVAAGHEQRGGPVEDSGGGEGRGEWGKRWREK